MEIIWILAIVALVVWRFLTYLDGMGRVANRIKRDALMQARCKVLANLYKEDKAYKCIKCTEFIGK
jgi:hypothetical protein